MTPKPGKHLFLVKGFVFICLMTCDRCSRLRCEAVDVGLEFPGLAIEHFAAGRKLGFDRLPPLIPSGVLTFEFLTHPVHIGELEFQRLLEQFQRCGLLVEPLLFIGELLLGMAVVIAWQAEPRFDIDWFGLGIRHDLEFQRSHAEAVADFERGIGEGPVVQPGGCPPTANHRLVSASQNQAMSRSNASRHQPKRVIAGRADRALRGRQPNQAPLLRRIAESKY